MAIEKMTYETRNLANIAKLAPNTKAATEKLYAKAKELGADILIYETLRTIEKQREYYNAGKSQTMKSYHLVGQALDFVPIVNGKEQWSFKAYVTEPYKSLVAYAKSLGFTWGADWDNDGSTTDESFVDSPHFQYEYKGYGTDKVAEHPAQPLPSGIIGQVRVTASSLRIRKGPGTNYAAVGFAKTGRVYNVTANVNDWHEIIIDAHTKGWVFGNNGQYLALVRG